MYNPEQPLNNPVYLRLKTIDAALISLEKAFNQQQSINITDMAQVQSIVEPEPEVRLNVVEQARRQVDNAFGSQATAVSTNVSLDQDDIRAVQDSDAAQVSVNLEELFKAANGVNR